MDPPRQAGFVITAASEVMAILALASSRKDLRKRLGDIVIGFDVNGRVLRASDLEATGAMMVLLNEAIMPNLVQTQREQRRRWYMPGPFANIAHGTSSVVSQHMAMGLADYVVNETGFAADLGAEKYLDIVMPSAGLRPSAAVLIVTVRALIEQGQGSIRSGCGNLEKHMEKPAQIPAAVRGRHLNHFTGDTEEQLDTVREFSKSAGVECAVVEAFTRGGAGARELAEKVMAVAGASTPEEVRPLYPPSYSIEQKVEDHRAGNLRSGRSVFRIGRAQEDPQVHGIGLRPPAGLHGENAVVVLRQSEAARPAHRMDPDSDRRAPCGGRRIHRGDRG